jgi:murein DD-endopeptidase MepM/ murein hydrolase activator NlpD
MPENVLDNGSFEQGHYDEGNCQIPNSWLLKARDGEYTVTGPEGNEYHTSLPESRLTECALLPEGERELFCVDGDYCLKIFGGRKAIHAWLFQEVSGLQVGAIYEFTAPLFVDTYLWDDGKVRPNLHPDEPRKRAARIRFTAADADREQHSVWHDEANVADWHLNKHVLTWGFEATAETMTVGFEVWNPWPVHNCGWFFDGLELVKTGEPEPEPEPPTGLPREQYPRAYNVIPPDTAPDKAAEIFLDGWIRSKETAGGSYDDAGIGDLEDKTANLHLIPADDRREYIDFYAEHYPNTRIRFIDAEGQEILWLSEPTTHVPHVVTAPYNQDRGDYVHKGLDLRSSWAHFGDELLAAIDGEIILVGIEEGREYFGTQVQIESYINGDRVVVRYAHLVPILDGGAYVEVGDEVRRGDPIGRPDNTGQSSGDHLHLDVRVNGFYVDPTPLIEWAEPEDVEPETPPVAGPQPPATDGPTVSFHVQAPEGGL